METISLITVFLAGMLSFISPCVLPLIPAYIALLAGAANKKDKDKEIKNKFYLNIASFLGGFTLTFFLMGMTASFLGQFFLEYQDIIRKICAIFMIVMGFYMLGIFKLHFLEQEYRPFLVNTFDGPLGAFIFGVGLTAGWTPCTGPVLATVLIQASMTGTVVKGGCMLIVFAMGFCMPFFIIGFLTRVSLQKLSGVYMYVPILYKIGGGIIVLLGTLLFFDLGYLIMGILIR